jgi:hypothetical protein
VETEAAEGDQPRAFNPRGGRRDRRFGSDRPFADRAQGERPTYHDRGFAQAGQPVVPLDQPQPDVSDDRALSTLPSFITGAPVVATPVPVPAPAPAPVAATPAPAPAAPAADAPAEAAAAEPSEGEGEARFPLRTRRRRTTKRASAEATPTDSETENAGD